MHSPFITSMLGPLILVSNNIFVMFHVVKLFTNNKNKALKRSKYLYFRLCYVWCLPYAHQDCKYDTSHCHNIIDLDKRFTIKYFQSDFKKWQRIFFLTSNYAQLINKAANSTTSYHTTEMYLYSHWLLINYHPWNA